MTTLLHRTRVTCRYCGVGPGHLKGCVMLLALTRPRQALRLPARVLGVSVVVGVAVTLWLVGG